MTLSQSVLSQRMALPSRSLPTRAFQTFESGVLARQAVAAERASVAASATRAAGGPGRAACAGLVPSKTSRHDALFVNTAPSACAERRVNRLKRSVWASGHLHGIADHGKRAPVCWFVTLTYAKANAWSPKHMSKAVERYRNWCRSVGVKARYTWVAEIQPKRLERTGEAVVHYHLLAWLPQGVSMPMWDRPVGRRHSFWAHGMSNREKAKAGVGYLMKYLSKLGEMTRFPKGLRLYGIGGLSAEGRSVRSWYTLPQWVQNQYGVGDVQRKKAGIVDLATGEILPKAFSCRVVPYGLEVTQLRPLPARFHDGAYCTFPRSLN